MGLQRVRHDWASFIFISFHFQWIFRFDPLAVQGTLKSLLQHCSSKASILWHLVLGIHWKDWCWSWNSNTLATWWEELTHWKRPWCWERLRAGGEGDDRGWDGSMASSTQWTWVWVDSGSWWWTGRPGVLQFMGSQRVGHDWETELNWTAFFIVQVSHVYMTTGKPIALTRRTFVDKVIFLLFNILSRLVKAFLPIDNAYFSIETQMFQCNCGAGYKNMFIPWHNLSTWSSISQCQGNLYSEWWR